jgi:hypothetical protein
MQVQPSVWRLTLLFYGYGAGMVFSRRIERVLYEDLAFSVFTGNQQLGPIDSRAMPSMWI